MATLYLARLSVPMFRKTIDIIGKYQFGAGGGTRTHTTF